METSKNDQPLLYGASVTYEHGGNLYIMPCI